MRFKIRRTIGNPVNLPESYALPGQSGEYVDLESLADLLRLQRVVSVAELGRDIPLILTDGDPPEIEIYDYYRE